MTLTSDRLAHLAISRLTRPAYPAGVQVTAAGSAAVTGGIYSRF